MDLENKSSHFYFQRLGPIFQLHQVGIYQQPWLQVRYVVGMDGVTYVLRIAKITSGRTFEPYSPRKLKWQYV